MKKTAPVRAKRKRVKFKYRSQPGSDVYLSGSFNNWDEATHKLRNGNSEGLHSISIFLPPGRHPYKFLIDGEWRIDPECPNWELNEFGTLNSLLIVE